MRIILAKDKANSFPPPSLCYSSSCFKRAFLFPLFETKKTKKVQNQLQVFERDAKFEVHAVIEKKIPLKTARTASVISL